VTTWAAGTGDAPDSGDTRPMVRSHPPATMRAAHAGAGRLTARASDSPHVAPLWVATARSATIFPGSCSARGARHRPGASRRPRFKPVTRMAWTSSAAPAWDTRPWPSADIRILGRAAVRLTESTLSSPWNGP
jgi:hypothetical protein